MQLRITDPDAVSAALVSCGRSLREVAELTAAYERTRPTRFRASSRQSLVELVHRRRATIDDRRAEALREVTGMSRDAFAWPERQVANALPDTTREEFTVGSHSTT